MYSQPFDNFYTLRTPVNFKFRTEFQAAEQVVKIHKSVKTGQSIHQINYSLLEKCEYE